MSYFPNRWQEIRVHYSENAKAIQETPKHEWAIHPYAWDKGIMAFTPIEAALWHDIRALGVVLYPQFPVGGVFVDFANPKAKVAIECDGRAFHTDAKKDAERDSSLREQGWTVYRIGGSNCFTDTNQETGRPGNAATFLARIALLHKIAPEADLKAMHSLISEEA